jgi:hypothetical protein
MDEVWTYEWKNILRISHLSINSCVKCAFNAQYQYVKCTNYEWTNVTWFSFLNHEILSLWWMEKKSTSVIKRLKLHTQLGW